MFSVHVPGKSQAQGSKVKTRWGVREDNPELGPWRERVALAAHDRMVHDKLLPVPAGEPLRVFLEFVRPRPKGHPKSYTKPCVTTPDLDKQVRAIFDALTHVVYADDAQIVTLVAEKRIAEIDEPPGVNIRVEREVQR